MLREGRILNPDRTLISDCLFSDVSLHGACVKLPMDVSVPRLLLVLDGRSGSVYPAELRWRRDRHIGLFISVGIPEWG